MIHQKYQMMAHKKVQATRKKEASVEKEPIIYGRSQKEIVLRVEIVILGVLFNQVKIDGMTEKKGNRTKESWKLQIQSRSI